MAQVESLSGALQCLHRNELSSAGRICAQVLKDEPRNPAAWHLLGIIKSRLGELEVAKAHFETASKLAPNDATYHYSLGVAWQSLDDHEQAANSYRAALARDATLLAARNNLANLLKDEGALEEAIACFRELVRQAPESSNGHYNLGNLLYNAGKAEEAIAHYHRAINLDPQNAPALENLGRAFAALGRLEEARNLWESWLDLDPENAIARHMLASVTGENIPERCDDRYVRDTFDAGFAGTFDAQLARLEYKVPELLSAAVRASGRKLVDLQVLDAGCGTGLCGPLVRTMATRLVGVDLSEDMLVVARNLEIYDQTIASELTAYMASCSQEFDLIISADTLCYFGNLEPVFRAASDCLRNDGLFVFSVERNASAGATRPYELQQHGRFRHAESYVVESLRANGWSIITLQREELRKEFGRPVDGLVVVAEPAR